MHGRGTSVVVPNLADKQCKLVQRLSCPERSPRPCCDEAKVSERPGVLIKLTFVGEGMLTTLLNVH